MGGGGAALGFVCIALIVVIPIALLIGAALLMAAVALANKCLPQPRSRYDDDYDDDWDDYDRPKRRNRGSGKAIPPPTLGGAVVIVIVNGVVSFVISFVLGFVMGAAGVANNPAAMLMLQGFNLVLGFLIAAGILTSMLPTTFPRACLVVVFQYLIVIAIAIVIVVPIVLVAGVAGGGLR